MFGCAFSQVPLSIYSPVYRSGSWYECLFLNEEEKNVRKILCSLLFALPLLAYDPWYTGPILAISGSNEPPGRLQFQPFFFVSSQYAAYSSNWKSQYHSNTTQLNYSNVFQSGITNWLDVSFFPQFFTTYSEGQPTH